ncbi:MAG: hypothetical protein IJW40_10595 [Clostridia bacterium]|nr:hypothetical protein [Clostridia bacterium]
MNHTDAKTRARMPHEGEPDTLLQRFTEPPEDAGLYLFYTPADMQVSEREISDFVRTQAARGVRCIVPRLAPALERGLLPPLPDVPIAADQQDAVRAAEATRAEENDRATLAFYRHVYAVLMETAHRHKIKVAFHIEQPIEQMVVRAARGSGMRAYMLTRREYYLNQEQSVSVLLCDKGKRLSVVAVDLRDGETVDLREMVDKNSLLRWDVPTGNWCVQEFICRLDPKPHANYLSYTASLACLEAAYALLADIFEGKYKDALGALYQSDIGFYAPNHRNWSPDFNDVFYAAHGCDPAPWYPHLYDVEDSNTTRVKSLMFSCRAAMLREGLYRALESFAAAHSLQLLCCAMEPKLAAPSAIAGDVVSNGAIASGAVLNRAYLYGFNSLKIAAAGAYNFGREIVSCELCRDYVRLEPSMLYKDAINALGRGANLLMAHTDGFPQTPSGEDPCGREYARFVSRASALLRGGSHVSDIAVLYPIHSLHASVSFYEAAARDFEYPDLPADADYTTLINALAFYAGQDVTLLHPDAMCDYCTVEENTLVLRHECLQECYRVLILPSARLISPQILRMVRRFYEAGGKVIATGERLPENAFVPLREAKEADAEVTEHMRAVFGADALDPDIVAGHLYHKNEAGGEAYWLYPGKTAADGSMMVDSVTVSRALYSFDLPLDVYIPAKPRHAATGALGNPYPEFAALGLDHILPGGGMLEHIHKHRDGCDVYYFGNSADRDFMGEVLLRGEHDRLVLCDPHTGQMQPLPYERVVRHGSPYTRVTLQIPAVTSRFVLGR